MIHMVAVLHSCELPETNSLLTRISSEPIVIFAIAETQTEFVGETDKYNLDLLLLFN